MPRRRALLLVVGAAALLVSACGDAPSAPRIGPTSASTLPPTSVTTEATTAPIQVSTPTPTPTEVSTPTPAPTPSPTPAPTPTPTPVPATINLGNVTCPTGNGLSPRPGLARFGAYLATFQISGYRQVPNYPSDYTNARVPGRISVRCSRDTYVIVELVFLNANMPFQQAMQLAMDELPEDAAQVYDHLHGSCRILQFKSAQLADQLGKGDADGVVNVDFESPPGTAYSNDTIGQVHIDILDRLNEDSGCQAGAHRSAQGDFSLVVARTLRTVARQLRAAATASVEPAFGAGSCGDGLEGHTIPLASCG